jgi:hypothetical protein
MLINARRCRYVRGIVDVERQQSEEGDGAEGKLCAQLHFSPRAEANADRAAIIRLTASQSHGGLHAVPESHVWL